MREREAGELLAWKPEQPPSVLNHQWRNPLAQLQGRTPSSETGPGASRAVAMCPFGGSTGSVLVPGGLGVKARGGRENSFHISPIQFF